MISLSPTQLATLTALANGIIPADEVDGGTSAVNAAPRLAEKIGAGINTSLYVKGLNLAESVAVQRYEVAVADLSTAQLHELLGHLRDVLPGFFKQLRMDVSALYLSDPDVWRRIGFAGPSTLTGGHADFAEPQTTTYTPIAATERPAAASQEQRRRSEPPA